MPVWFTQFFFLGTGFIMILIMNQEKLEALEEKYDARKKEKKVRSKHR